MLSWTRWALVSLALCALLSLTLVTAAALACPGGGEEAPRERVTLEPERWTFSSVGETKRFIFTYNEGSGEQRVTLRILPGGRFVVLPFTENTCLERGGAYIRLRPGQHCEFLVEQSSRTGEERATLTGELFNGRNDRSELIG
jgi:hypothetical protein